MKSKRFSTRTIIVLLASTISLSFASTARADDGWKFAIVPYLWLPAISSDFSVDGIEVDGDRVELGESSTFFDDLSFRGVPVLLKAQAEKGKFVTVFDLQYVSLGQEGSVALAPTRDYDAEFTVATSTLALGYRVVDQQKFTLDLFGGARALYAEVDAEIKATDSDSSLEGDGDKFFLDPIVGTQVRFFFNDKWSIYGYADIGGFDVGTKLSYQALGAIGYHFNKNLSLHVGYQFFGVDFEKGPLNLDIDIHGPVIGLAISF